MRRFQPSSMSAAKLSKAYENVSRPGTFSSGPLLSLSKDRLIKLTAILVATLIGISALHAVLSPQHLIYGLMIDAGSTGSRIHTYSFHRANPDKLDLLHEDFHALKPGLSSYKDDPPAAAASLQPLLERALARVPVHAQAETPVVLRATAGLRMVGDEVAEKILGEVRAVLRESPFRFDADDWATILKGSEEGVYSWITVNYLLDRAADETVGTLEMGGGSSQVAYVPRDESMKAVGNCSLAAEKVPFKGKELELYTASHLNFGLQRGRAVALNVFEEDNRLSENVCVNNGGSVEVAVPFDEGGKKLTISGAGNFGKCRELIRETVMKPAIEASCACEMCTYHGAPQPAAIKEYVAIAFYLERTVAIGMQTPLTVEDIRKKGEEVCGMTVAEVRGSFAAVPNGEATDLCFDLAFIVEHLEIGHGITEDAGVELMVLDKIKDVELGWCLGAMQQTMGQLGLAR